MTARRVHTNDHGQVTVFLAILSLALLFVAGLVVDGGRLLTAKRQAANIAEHAARAGAQHLDVDQLRATGVHVLSPHEAAVAARRYLAATGHQGSVAVSAEAVTVSVTIDTPLHILRLAGPARMTVTGTATARNVRGVSSPEP